MSTPDWIMLGVPYGDQFAIYASTEINEAELRTELVNERDLYADFGRSPYLESSGIPPIYEHAIRATMRKYVVVIAPTYAAAFRALFDQWTPQASRRGAVDGVRPAIGG